jgi:hypothetical protein
MDNIFEKLWPKLEMIVMAKQGNMRIYTERIRKYTGNIKLYSPVYAVPECTIGYNVNNDDSYAIDPRKGYFEFIHINENYLNDNIVDKKTISMRSLNIGELYLIVVSSTSSDINRFIVGDVIRVLGFINGCPRFDLMCHEHDLLLIKNKIVTPYDIEMILLKDFSLIDYCYRRIKRSKLKLYIELEPQDYLQNNNKFYDLKEKIKKINIQKHILKQFEVDMEIRVVLPGTFDMIFQNRYSDNVDPSLIQIPRRIIDAHDIEILKENILYLYPQIPLF